MHHRAYPRLTRSTPGLNTSLIAVYISPPVHAAMPVPLRFRTETRVKPRNTPIDSQFLVSNSLTRSFIYYYYYFWKMMKWIFVYFYSNRRSLWDFLEIFDFNHYNFTFNFYNIPFFFIFSAIVFQIVAFDFNGVTNIYTWKMIFRYFGRLQSLYYIDYISFPIEKCVHDCILEWDDEMTRIWVRVYFYSNRRSLWDSLWICFILTTVQLYLYLLKYSLSLSTIQIFAFDFNGVTNVYIYTWKMIFLEVSITVISIAL